MAQPSSVTERRGRIEHANVAGGRIVRFRESKPRIQRQVVFVPFVRSSFLDVHQRARSNRPRTVVRGGFGLYYDRIPLRAVANALLSSGNTTTLNGQSQLSLSLSPTQAGAPVFPNILSTPPAAGLVNFTTMAPRMQNAYSTQGSLEFEQQLGQQ